MCYYSNKLKNALNILVKKHPFNYSQCCCSKQYSELKTEIDNATNFLDKFNVNYKTRIFYILNDIYQVQKCCICGEVVDKNVLTLKTGFFKYTEWNNMFLSSLTCSNPKCVKAQKQQITKQTNIERYGVDNPWKAGVVKQKIKKTNIERYGISNGGNTKANRQKARETLIKHYGADGLKSKEIRKKVKQTNIERYGVASYTKSLDYKIKTQNRNLKKFICKLQIDPEIEILSALDTFKCVDELIATTIRAKCKKCGNIFDFNINLNNFYKYGTYSSCQNCHPSYSKSFFEKQIVDFVKTLRFDVIENDRSLIKPYEIDLFLPSKNIAIEFDGIFWHSDDNGMNKNYHLNKTELCEKQGIQLIHIFENEWVLKQDIVKSRIKNLLGIYDKTIYARKCEIKEVSSKESKDFQNNNHIQGSVNSGINLGLYFKDELVSLMTFGKCRFNKKYEYELLRFCNKLGYHIPGSASKLLKYFERNYQPKSLISYADRRWSKGNVYEKLGFKLDHISDPNYWYWKNGSLILESRVKYQKHKLPNILENFDKTKSEIENMKVNGYHRIFDCGNLVFQKLSNN